MNLKAKTALFLSTGFYIGYAPFAPGTLGSFEGLFFCYLLSKIPLGAALVATLIFIALAIWIAHEAEKVIASKDPGCIVIDEVAGMMVTLLGLPFTPVVALAGFLLFRVLDVFKPPPIRTVERKMTGGVGIVLDDILAGIIANLILRLILLIGILG